MVDIRSAPPPDDEPYSHLRIPPSSMDAEAALLGGILLNPRAYDLVYDVVSEHDFYRATHRTLWRLLAQRIDAGKPVDVITILDLCDDETRPIIGPLVAGTPSAVNVRRYAEIIRGKAILRSLIAAGTEIAETAFAIGADPQEVAERAEALVLSVADKDARETDREPATLYEAFARAVDWLDAEKPEGIPTGFAALDALLPGQGLQPEQLIVVAGRPSMGKSSFTYNVAEHNALQGRTVAYFALETSVREIGRRALKWHEQNLGRSEALRLVADVPLLIDDTPAVTLAHIRIRCRRIRRQRGLSLIVVDYLQLMRQRAQSRLEEVSEISRGLKAIAKEFGVPVVVVSQLNRSVEQRPDKRPVLSDLRESGQIEQDADVVLMCYREHYYTNDPVMERFGSIFVRKNRDGPVGEAFLRWSGPYTRWIDYTGPRPDTSDTVIAGDSTTVRAFKPKRGADQ